MHFCDGKLGAYERLMTQKPGYSRRTGKSGKDGSQKKALTKKQEHPSKSKEREEQENG